MRTIMGARPLLREASICTGRAPHSDTAYVHDPVNDRLHCSRIKHQRPERFAMLHYTTNDATATLSGPTNDTHQVPSGHLC